MGLTSNNAPPLMPSCYSNNGRGFLIQGFIEVHDKVLNTLDQ